MNGRVKEALADDPDATGRLKLAARMYLHFAFENPARFAVMFHSDFDRRAHEEYVAAYTEALTVLTQLIEACGALGATSAATAGELVWASVHGIAELGLAQRLSGTTEAELEPLVDSAIESLLHGMPKVFGAPAKSLRNAARRAS